MSVSHVRGDVYAVDPHLRGMPGALSMYAIDAPRPALVDAATANAVPRVLDAIEEVGLDPEDVEVVFVSHVHLDHAGGAGHLAEELPNAVFYVHERGLPYLTDEVDLARLKRSVERALGDPIEETYGDPRTVPESRCRAVAGGETVDLGDRTLDLLEAPGHAPHHFAAFDPTSGDLFSIDAAGMYLAGEMRPTTPPPAFDLEANLDTVARLRALDPERNYYGHVGPGGDDAVAELDRYADMLEAWVDLVARKREEHGEDVEAIVGSLPSGWHSPTVGRDVAGVLAYLEG